MSDKLDQADETIDIFDQLVHERDELRETVQTFVRAARAEAKKTDELRAELVTVRRALATEMRFHDHRRAEVERLNRVVERARLAYKGWEEVAHEKEAENERLRAALERLVAACEREDWDEPDPDLVAAREALVSAKE